jgi:small GTP-binding protein
MAKKKGQQGRRANQEPTEPPAGVVLLRTLKGHNDMIYGVAFDPQGGTLASGSTDNTVKLWKVSSGKLLRTLEGHRGDIISVAFDSQGETLASAGGNEVKLWDVSSGKLLRTIKETGNTITSLAFDPRSSTLACTNLKGETKLWTSSSGGLLRDFGRPNDAGMSVAFDPRGRMLVSAGFSGRIYVFEARNLTKISELEGHQHVINCLAFDPQGSVLASGSADRTVKLWDVDRGKLLRTLEGHTNSVSRVAFSADGHLLASKGLDQAIRLWSCQTWEPVAIVPPSTPTIGGMGAFAFHPHLPLLAGPAGENFELIQLWKLDPDVLLRERAGVATAPPAHHVTGKIVLVGDHSVGKSALGYRLIHGAFKEQASTHGQQFWVFPALGQRRSDGTDCEAILWDFAGQPDYRLVHALFVDNADLALVLFDASDLHDPLGGVAFWLKQLQAGQIRCPIILVAAQTDRGTCPLTPEELRAFCQREGIAGPIATSSLTGQGFDKLLARMKSLIPWDDKAATVTTSTFKRIKDYVLGLKETESERRIIVTPQELRARLQATDARWSFTDAEMLTAVGHLENYGYVKRLRTSKGEQRVLLQPERLNNLASSFVLEARRNPRGLGALEENRLLAGEYQFPELKDLPQNDREVLLDSAALLFLEHNVCFRETDPLRMEPYLVFPELINLKKPPDDEPAVEDSVAFTVSGPTKNVFASLVVLLGYTHTFTRTRQWHNNARYEVGDGLVCGFRQEAERDGELEVVLCFGPDVDLPVRRLFQGLFESFLARRNLTVMRYEPVRCSKPKCNRLQDRSVVRQRLKEGLSFTFCSNCGKKLSLPAMVESIQLSRDLQDQVGWQRHTAEQRTRFEQAIFRVHAYVAEQNITPPETFISYAWDGPERDRWVEKRLATDLQKAGINVLLDRWHNAQIGANVARFAERIEKCNRVVVVGTPAYRRKYENKDASKGYVVAAEVDLINNRLLGTEAQKESVLPLLLAGDPENSLPPLLQGRVYADFRDEITYFATAFDLILSLYQLARTHRAVADLRESLHGRQLRP